MPIVEVADGASIVIGPRVSLISTSTMTALGVCHPVVLRAMCPGAQIRIGADSGLSGTSICAATSVTIGDRCLLGADAIVADTDFHAVDAVPRRDLPLRDADSRPVTVGNDVFLGARSIVLKGVKIADGAVLGAGSVLGKSIEGASVWAGNPAQFLRELRCGK